MKKCLFLLFMALLVSCAAPQNISIPKESFKERLSMFNSYPCCLDLNLNSFDIERFETGQVKEFLLNEIPTKYKSTVGRSPLFITEAVEQDVSYYILRSYIEKDVVTSEKFAVVPIILVLNDDYSISRQSKFEHLRHMSWTVWGQKEHFDIYLKIDKSKNPREKYIVVVTPEKTLGQKLLYSSQPNGSTMVIPSGNGLMAMSVGGAATIEYFSSPYGALQLKHITNKLEIPYDWAIEF